VARVQEWFHNARGVVVVLLAVATGVVLLAIDPGNGFPTGASSSNGNAAPLISTPSTVAPPTTTAAPHPTLQVGSPDAADVTLLQQRLNTLGYSVGTPDGVFGDGTKAQVIAFQTKAGLPADGIVNQATWAALLAPPKA
jgi:peptidoglycan hydrolase-like protein with peptidoglycan-binding domain